MEFEPQFIWGVFSAIDPSDSYDGSVVPYADGNTKFWMGSPRPQLSQAKFEIVCWDSSATLFIGIDDSLVQKLVGIYPDISNLDEINRLNKIPKG